MSSDIISSLQLDRELSTSRVIVAKEINGCDSSFVISCVLGHCIKNKKAVIIVATHNSLLHYHNVGLKMNYNLQKQVDSGLIFFYDLGEDIVNSSLENNVIDLNNIFETIKETFIKLKDSYETVNIIFDGLSHLFDLEHSVKNVNKFCKDVISVVRDCNNCYVMFHCNVACDDDVTSMMANLLSRKAHIVLEVESLSSGWSADVSGHLTLKYNGKKFEDDHLYILDMRPSKYLFKLFDRGVKLLAPGTV